MIDFTGNNTETNHDNEELNMNYNIENLLDQTHHLIPRMRRIKNALIENALTAPKILTEEPITTNPQAVKLIHELAPTSNTPNLELAAQAVLNGEDPTEHMRNYATWFYTHTLADHLISASRQNFVDALNEHADDLTEQVRRKIFTPALRQLKTLVKNHPGKTWDMEAAINNKDFAQAAVIDKNQHIATQLDTAYKIRELLYNENAFTTPAAYLTTPGYKGTTNTKSLAWWVLTISNGHTPHLPTANEWEALYNSKEHADVRKADAEALAADQPDAPTVQTLMHEGRMMSR